LLLLVSPGSAWEDSRIPQIWEAAFTENIDVFQGAAATQQQVLHNLAATVIQAYLGHRSIMSTVRYTAMTPNRFKNFWKD
jgi:hypothetical protein